MLIKLFLVCVLNVVSAIKLQESLKYMHISSCVYIRIAKYALYCVRYDVNTSGIKLRVK